jgi:hypothetical protein
MPTTDALKNRRYTKPEEICSELVGVCNRQKKRAHPEG